MTPHFPEVFDSTILSIAKSCRYKFWLHSCEEWKPVGTSVHLHAGGAFAKGLEIARKAFHEEGASPEEAEAMGLGALISAYGNFECPADSAKSLERTAGALEYYFDNWPLESDPAQPVTFPSGKRGIEFNFVEPLPINHPETGQPLLFSGRADQVVEFASDVYLEDDKTATQLGASWAKQWDLRAQFSSYCWGLRQVGGISPRGVLIRGVAILKTQYNRAEVLTYRAPWQIDEWFETTCLLIEDLIRDWKREIWMKALDEACNDWGGCAYRQVCLSQDPEPWLNQYYERRHWDPVTRTETLL